MRSWTATVSEQIILTQTYAQEYIPQATADNKQKDYCRSKEMIEVEVLLNISLWLESS